jgi:hypothetical protein
MIESILDKLESYFNLKRPDGRFCRYNSYAEIPLADFEDDDILIEFRETDEDCVVDVRFLLPDDSESMISFAWDVLTGDYYSYIGQGKKIDMADIIMDKIRYLNNNALDFILRQGEGEC